MKTVVIVDNSQKALDNYNRMLEVCKEEINCKYFKYPENALDYIRKEGAAVLVCELDMPVMSGKEVFDMVEILSPDTIKIAMSQVTDVRETLEIVNHSRIFKLILKPFFFPEDILNPIKEALSYYKHRKRKKGEEDALIEPERLKEEIQSRADELEGREHTYYNISRTINGIFRGNLECGTPELSGEEKTEINRLLEGMFLEFIRYDMQDSQDTGFHADYLMKLFHCPKEHRVFQIKNENSQEIPNENFRKMAYTMVIVGYLAKHFWGQYQLKAEIVETEQEYMLELILKFLKRDGKIAETIMQMEEQMIHSFAERTVKKISGNLLVQKVYYKKGEETG